jgi:hypothetical protein
MMQSTTVNVADVGLRRSMGSLSLRSKKFRSRDEKQLHRFYEPLVLLHTLGSTRGYRTLEDSARTMYSLSIRDMRRKFLKALAYACDYEKGGETVASIGLQHKPEANIFWVASNKDPTIKILPFLRTVLAKLANGSTDENALEEDIRRSCIELATPRIKKYRKLMSQTIKKAHSELAKLNDSTYNLSILGQRIKLLTP